MIQWDDNRQMVVDEMGIPLSKKEAREWMEALRAHLKNTPKKLCAAAVDVLSQRYPNMVEQVDYTPGRFE